jgi:hypothetical protein
MKIKLAKMLTYVMVCTFLASCFYFNVTAPARAAPTVSIFNSTTGSPDFNFTSGQKNIGDLIKMNISISGATNIGTWQVGIQWDKTALTFASMTLPSDHIFVNSGPIGTPPDSSVPGLVVMGVSIGPGQPGFTGSGTMAQLTLNITRLPTAGETISTNITFEGYTVDTFILDASLTDITSQYTFNAAHYNYVGPSGPPPSAHDVGITKIQPASNFVANDSTLNIAVTVVNNGTFTETFPVEVFANGTDVAPSQSATLTAGNSTTLNFVWNATGLALGAYDINATATLAGDPSPGDNTLNYGTVQVTPPGLLGDVNGDGKVDMTDIAIIVIAFNTWPGKARWNPNCDLDHNGWVNLRDIIIALMNYGKHT